jgi:hypothetical protein
MGVQLFWPAMAGMPGAIGPATAAATRRRRAATRRFWNSSNRRCQKVRGTAARAASP